MNRWKINEVYERYKARLLTHPGVDCCGVDKNGIVIYAAYNCNLPQEIEGIKVKVDICDNFST